MAKPRLAHTGALGATSIAQGLVAAAVTGGLTYVLAAPLKARTPPGGDTASESEGPGRGRGAETPTEIPARGWRDILSRTFAEFSSDNITTIAGGVTFSVLLAIFPAFGAFVAVYGLVADVNQIPGQLQILSLVLPGDVVKFLSGEMTRLTQVRHGGLSLALAAGLLLSFWSANGAMKSLFVGMNVAYEEHERRGVVKLNLMTFAFTLGLIAFLVAVTVALTAGALAERLLGPSIALLIQVARWPLMVVVFGAGLAVVYRYAPSREHARWRWVTPGSVIAAVLWFLASLLFSLYASHFAHYDRTYGSLGAVIALMIWIWISAVIILLGAELNSEIEHQTTIDSTTGTPQPMGTRGAKMADTLGKPRARR